MKIAFSWDDGALEDRELFELHNKYEIPGMFFIPTKNREGRSVLTGGDLKNSESKYVQFGGHTENHTYLTDIPFAGVESEVKNNKDYLENILGHSVDHFCFPGGKYNDAIMHTVRKYYTTVRTADTMCFNNSSGLIKPAFHFYPRGVKSLIGNAVRNGSYKEGLYVLRNRKRDYFDLIMGMLDMHANDDAVIIIWGHSWEIELMGLWEKLDNLFKRLYAEYLSDCVEYGALFGE